jgi:SAM-dependent methyltransferase
LIQAWTESFLRYKKKINFRKRRNKEAVEAYGQMTLQEFEGVNARQQWANWLTLPKTLTDVLPNRPLQAIDLCCGVGHSTEVLAYYLPSGSSILGIEYTPSFLRKAASRRYFHANGSLCNSSFQEQSVLERWTNADDMELADNSFDLVNTSGAVGSHFDPASTDLLAREAARVLKRGGIASIDSGFAGTRRKQVIQIFKAHGFNLVRSTKSCFFDIYTQICFIKG